jgi:hypothetical protein
MDDRHLTTLLERTYPSAPVPPLERLEQRAVAIRRRRRTLRAASAVATAAIVVLAVVATLPGGNDRSVQTPLGSVPATPAPAPTPLGAPLVQGADPASTLLTSWSQFHVGYAFIYGDGRVLWYTGVWVDANGRVTGYPGGPDPLVAYDKDGATRFKFRGVQQWLVLERRLSARGLGRVHAGAIEPSDLFSLDAAKSLHEHRKLWAEPTPRISKFTKYALCPSSNIPGEVVAATDVVDELPAPVRAVLDGKQRTYDPRIGTAHWEFPGPGQLADCFELTAAETSTLYQMLDANGQIFNKSQQPNPPQGWDGVFKYGRLIFAPWPIFPHGQYVVWGG